jgi:DNA-binding NtrC family response regulator
MLEDVIKHTVKQALIFTDGDIAYTAVMLGTSRMKLYRLIKKHQLEEFVDDMRKKWLLG